MYTILGNYQDILNILSGYHTNTWNVVFHPNRCNFAEIAVLCIYEDENVKRIFLAQKFCRPFITFTGSYIIFTRIKCFSKMLKHFQMTEKSTFMTNK